MNKITLQRLYKNFIVSFIACLFALVPLTVIFWPGKTSPDTLTQISQALGFTPMSVLTIVFMTLLIKLFIFKTSGTILYFILQSFIVAISCALGTSILFTTFLSPHSNIKKHIWLFLTNIFLCLFPPVGLINVVLWKDIPFSWCAYLMICCSVSMSFIYSKKSKLNKKSIYDYSSFLLYSSCFSAFVMLCFRLNAITLVLPFFMLNCFLYYKFLDKSIKNISIVTLLVILAIFLQFFLIKIFISQEVLDDFNKLTVRNTIITDDFGVMLHNGYKLNDKDKEFLNLYLDIDKYIANTNPANAYYQLSLLSYSKISDFWLSQEKFVEVGQRVLLQHPVEWIKINLNYYFHFIHSVKGYQMPIFDETAPPLNVHGIRLDMNPKFSEIREVFVRLMGRNGGAFYITKFAWTYWPEFIFETLFMFLLLYISFFDFNKQISPKYIKLIATFEAFRDNKVMLSLPIIASICLSLPVMFITLNNDFRYFLANIFFFYVLIFLIIFILFRTYRNKRGWEN